MGNLHIVTIVIIAANAIISYKGFGDYNFFDKYKFQVGAIQRGEKIRLFSSGFLHADTQHLLFNMITLYFFANEVIALTSTLSFIFIYFGSLLLGSLLSLYFHKNEYHYSAVGASGAVTGILYSAILLQNKIGNIGHDAHFGGAIGGFIITLVLSPWLFQTNLLMIGLLSLPIILLFILKKAGKM